MDNVTHGLIGALLCQAFSKKNSPRWIPLVGALGGMAPDLDVLIHSSFNPFLSLQFHRHFTHSIFFIPIGGALIGMILRFLFFRKKQLSEVCLFSTIGYSTHCFLDSFTSYGTLLFWPLSHSRISWDVISIIDPIFSMIVFLGMILGLIFRKNGWPRFFLFICFAYLLLGAVQRNRALEVQQSIAELRKEKIEKGRVLPTLGNIFVWRSIYETKGEFKIDAIRIGLESDDRFWEGTSVRKHTLEPIFSITKKMETFEWFSQGWVGEISDPTEGINRKRKIIDLRYSSLPHTIDSIWGIEWTPGEENTRFIRFSFSDPERKISKKIGQLWSMVIGTDIDAKIIRKLIIEQEEK